MRTQSNAHPQFSLTLERLAFWAVALAATSLYWLSPWLKMVDAPQHAAQVQMFLDLLMHRSPWQDQLQINLFTPYWIGYGVTAVLALLFSVPTALKVALSIAWLSFVLSGTWLRRSVGNPAWWDWFLLPTFFGFAHEWGFITFLLSIPFALVFAVRAREYSLEPTRRRGLGLIALGTLLFFCHLLILIFCLALGATVALLRARSRMDGLQRLLPFAGCTPLVSLWWLTRLQAEGQSQLPTLWHLGWYRLARLGAYLTGLDGLSWLLVGFVALGFLAGARLRREPADWVGLAMVGAILFFVPDRVLGNGFTFQRFAVFLVPMAFLAFEGGVPRMTRLRGFAGRTVPWTVGLGTIVILGFQARSTLRFAKENREFIRVLQAIPPGARVLSLVFDPWNSHSDVAPTYLHFPVWYQCERGGLVDFNFACFYPQIVRYAPGHLPPTKAGIEWNPIRFLHPQFDLHPYRYVVFRSNVPLPKAFLSRPTCVLVPVYLSNPWWVFECKPLTGPIPS